MRTGFGGSLVGFVVEEGGSGEENEVEEREARFSKENELKMGKTGAYFLNRIS